MGLVEFLAGRADDTGARRQISKNAFMSLAQELGINVTAANIAEIVGRPPLSNMLEPLDPSSDVITFRGGEVTPTQMPVSKAQDIVARAAKSALNKRT
jgi:hypothetical protein